jgi:hypothetical protein
LKRLWHIYTSSSAVAGKRTDLRQIFGREAWNGSESPLIEHRAKQEWGRYTAKRQPKQ